jgi:hypothetical protein
MRIGREGAIGESFSFVLMSYFSHIKHGSQQSGVYSQTHTPTN